MNEYLEPYAIQWNRTAILPHYVVQKQYISKDFNWRDSEANFQKVNINKVLKNIDIARIHTNRNVINALLNNPIYSSKATQLGLAILSDQCRNNYTATTTTTNNSKGCKKFKPITKIFRSFFWYLFRESDYLKGKIMGFQQQILLPTLVSLNANRSSSTTTTKEQFLEFSFSSFPFFKMIGIHIRTGDMDKLGGGLPENQRDIPTTVVFPNSLNARWK